MDKYTFLKSVVLGCTLLLLNSQEVFSQDSISKKPVRKSFIQNFKKKEKENDNQRKKRFSKYLKKYKVSEYSEKNKYYMILEVTLSGSLKKGEIITFYYTQSETTTGTSGPTEKWVRKYKLLDNFAPNTTVRLQNLSSGNEGFIDEFNSIRCYELFRETYMALNYSGTKSVKLKVSW